MGSILQPFDLLTKFWDLARKLQLEIERVLYHFNDLFAEARMYQNLHGRFTAVDPLLASGKSANPQTFNRYVYVMNNPLIYTDPTGLQAATTITEGRWYSPNFADNAK